MLTSQFQMKLLTSQVTSQSKLLRFLYSPIDNQMPAHMHIIHYIKMLISNSKRNPVAIFENI